MARFLISALGLILLLWVPDHRVRGQSVVPGTGTPTASPVTTPAPLSAADLVNAAAQAQWDKGTAHFQTVITLVTPGFSRMVQTSHGDVSFRKGANHEYDRIRTTHLDRIPHVSQVTHRQSVYMASTLAERTNRGTWKCTRLSGAAGQYAQIGAVLKDTANTTIGFASPDTRIVGGIAAWHVHITIELPGLTPGGHPIEQDLDIAQSDNTLLRDTIASWIRVPVAAGSKPRSVLMTEHETDVYTRYGTPVSIHLPPTCAPAPQR